MASAMPLTPDDQRRAATVLRWLEAMQPTEPGAAWARELKSMIACNIKGEIEAAGQAPAEPGAVHGLAQWVWTRLADHGRWL